MGDGRPSWFDDLGVGMEWRSEPRLVDAALIHQFANLTGDFTPIHLDAAAAQAAGYTGPLAHGVLVLALATGLLAQMGHLAASTLAIRRMTWECPHPVLAGTTVHCVARVGQTRPVSSVSGLVRLELAVVDESAQTLQHGRLDLVVRRHARE